MCCFHTFIIWLILGQTCKCHPNSVTEIVYDSSLRQPICRSTNCSSNAPNCITKSPSSTHCPLLYLHEAINSVQPSKYIQIVDATMSLRGDNVSQAKCDRKVTACTESKNYERFENFCIPQTLLKDYQSYRQFKAPAPTTIDIYASLHFLVFFCQILRQPVYCEQIANLCVLSKYERISNFNFCESDSTTVSICFAFLSSST